MNANQLINMIIRVFTRKVIGKGMNAGFKMASSQMQARAPAPQNDPAPVQPELTKEERQQRRQARKARQAARQVRLAAKQGRKVTRL